MIVLARLRECSPFYVSMSYMGETIENALEGEFIGIKKTIQIAEQVLPIIENGKIVGQRVGNDVTTTSLIGNGTLRFKSSDFLFIREVDKDDEIMKNYEKCLVDLREKKAGLVKASSLSSARLVEA